MDSIYRGYIESFEHTELYKINIWDQLTLQDLVMVAWFNMQSVY